jgi:hypothetical protein
MRALRTTSKVAILLGALASIASMDRAIAQPNDVCDSPVPITLPSITSGSTNGATIDAPPVPGCNPDGITGPGVWFSVIGTGNPITATTCPTANGSATFDTVISVYCRGCGCSLCVATDDDTCGSAPSRSTVTWMSQTGLQYEILVHGANGATGNFELSAFEGGTPGPPLDCTPPPNPPPPQTFLVFCPTHPCSSGLPWSMDLVWDGTGVFSVPACGPVPVPASTAQDKTTALLSCFNNATTCPDIHATQTSCVVGATSSWCTFDVQMPSGTIDICIPDQSGVCTSTGVVVFNPELQEIELSGNDCNDNDVDDAIDIPVGNSVDGDGNGIPDECDDQAVPTVSQWGMVLLTMLFLGTAIWLFRRPSMQP